MHSKNEVDAIIVGSGMAGSAISYMLARAGAKVVLLEQGPDIHPTDHPTFSSHWEVALSREWAPNPNVRGLDHDYPVTGARFRPYMYNGVGGSTNHYAGFWHRLKPVDFRKGTEHGVGNTIDWPLTYEELEPYYDWNDQLVGVSGSGSDPAYPPRKTDTQPMVRHGRYNDLISNGLEQLGWHWWPAYNAILTEARDGRLPCNGCGMCILGCPRRSLGTATQAYLRDALKRGLDLRSGSRVVRITTDHLGAANGVEYINLASGEMHRASAPLVVLAANGIGSPRILLNSKSPQHPEGLGNNVGIVGQNLLLHGYMLADLWFDEDTEHYKGPFGAGVYSQEFYDTDLSREFVNGMTITFGGAWGAATTAMGATTQASPTGWGAGHHEAFAARFNRHVFAAVQVDDIAQADNAVTLDPDVTDSSGIPAARANYDPHENDLLSLTFGRERLLEIGQAAGATQVDCEPLDDSYAPPGWHLMGTCRMGDDINSSVVDSYHRSWSVPGLVVCDGSSMTTGGAGNPTSTIGALALRCGENLIREMSRRVEASHR